jgi:hypothetical protein
MIFSHCINRLTTGDIDPHEVFNSGFWQLYFKKTLQI